MGGHDLFGTVWLADFKVVTLSGKQVVAGRCIDPVDKLILTEQAGIFRLVGGDFGEEGGVST